MQNEKSRLARVWELFATFFKIGMFTFGGGYAMISLIEEEAVTRKKWSDGKEFLDIIAIAESTPGPIAVNSATFIGYKVAGFWGSVSATIGVVVPSFIIITLVTLFLNQFNENTYVQRAFAGIRAGVVVLMVGAVKKLSQKLEKNKFTIAVMVAAFCGVTFLNLSTFLVLVLSALSGVLYNAAIAKGAGK